MNILNYSNEKIPEKLTLCDLASGITFRIRDGTDKDLYLKISSQLDCIELGHREEIIYAVNLINNDLCCFVKSTIVIPIYHEVTLNYRYLYNKKNSMFTL